MQNPRVLVVEDDEDVLEVTCQVLETMLEIDPACVKTGQEALDLLSKQDFDVLLLDLRLGDMRGEKILEFIREKSLKVKPIIVTGSEEELKKSNCVALGAYDFFTKPMNFRLCIDSIDQILSNRLLPIEIIVEKARALKKTYKFGEKLLTLDDFFKLASQLGIEVHLYNYKAHVKGIIAYLGSKPYIGLQDTLNDTEKKSIGFHEIGHFFLHPEESFVTSSIERIKALNKQADIFASILLVPDSVISSLADGILHDEAIRKITAECDVAEFIASARLVTWER